MTMTTTQKKTPTPVQGVGAELDKKPLVESVGGLCPAGDPKAINLAFYALACCTGEVLP